MNPLFKALMGGFTGAQNLAGQSAHIMPNNGFSGIFGQAQQLANMFRNPQQLVQRFFPDAPAEIANDPEQLLGWMQQTGKTNPQMVQMARQMIGSRPPF